VRTLVFIAAGLVVLAAFALIGARFGGGAQAIALAAKIFLPLWLAAALVNMWFGVARAGYSVGEELPVLLVLFGVPAAVAVLLWWKYG